MMNMFIDMIYTKLKLYIPHIRTMLIPLYVYFATLISPIIASQYRIHAIAHIKSMN
jgi:hypothetical protein